VVVAAFSDGGIILDAACGWTPFPTTKECLIFS